MGISAIADLMSFISGFLGASYRLTGKASKGLAVNERKSLSDIVASLSVALTYPCRFCSGACRQVT